ncbi:helix-turn-helix domain-containing protein [Pseudonocardia kongjuensis]|uniref:Helix-turn-helix domain-containing protein n=1 Tax=Pseudonocardia kongjuensis TaxID=102227 RepID=A0ABN1XWD6_9PSEU
MNPGEAGPIRGAETARRTVRLLQALSARQPILLEELCEVVGLNRSTTYRLVRVLQEENFVERLPRGGGYRLGSAVTALASRAPLPVDLLAEARPALAELAEVTGETVCLHRRVDDRAVLCLGVESERHVLRHVIRIGDAHPLVRGAAGTSILAHLGDAPEILDRAGPAVAQRGELEELLRRVVERGYATSRGENHPGLYGVAAPVLPPGGGEPELAVSVSGPEQRWGDEDARRHADALRACCARISYVVT